MNLTHNLLVDQLTKHTQALAHPLGRRVGQPGHDVARQYVLKQMQRIGLKPFCGDSYELTYELPHPNTGKLRKALGPVATTWPRAMGIKLPESRKDLDRFVTNLIDGKPLK